MKHKKDGESRRVRRNQVLLFSGIASMVLAAFSLWIASPGGRAPAPAPRIEAELAGPGTAEESWTRRSEARLGLMEARLKDMESDSRRLKEENGRLRAQLEENAEDARRTIDRQAALIEDFVQAPDSSTFQASGPDSFDPRGVGMNIFSDASGTRGNAGQTQTDLALRQAKSWNGGCYEIAETIHRSPTGSTPVR